MNWIDVANVRLIDCKHGNFHVRVNFLYFAIIHLSQNFPPRENYTITGMKAF